MTSIPAPLSTPRASPPSTTYSNAETRPSQWVVESSRRSFKAQNSIIYHPPTDPTAPTLLGAADLNDYLASPERIEGTFTLPVCDGSSLLEFNINYEDANEKKASPPPPCFCGINGAETANFMKAVGLDAKDQARRCFDYWTFVGTDRWPQGAESVSYGDGKGTSVSKSAVDKCRKQSGASDPGYCQVG